MKLFENVDVNVQEIKLAQIQRVYTGKAKCCYCGCSGKYWDDDRNKMRVLKAVQKQGGGDLEAFKCELPDDEGVIVTRTSGQREYTLYLK